MAGAGHACYAGCVLKLAILLALLGGAAAAFAWAPVHGRPLLDRWREAPDASAFLARGVEEARAALLEGGRDGHPQGAAPHPARSGRAPRPVEKHSERDRAALDRIVAEHAGR